MLLKKSKTEALRFPVYGAYTPPHLGRYTRACVLDGLSQGQLQSIWMGLTRGSLVGSIKNFPLLPE